VGNVLLELDHVVQRIVAPESQLQVLQVLLVCGDCLDKSIAQVVLHVSQDSTTINEELATKLLNVERREVLLF
jgi:hypothetical protein